MDHANSKLKPVPRPEGKDRRDFKNATFEARVGGIHRKKTLEGNVSGRKPGWNRFSQKESLKKIILGQGEEAGTVHQGRVEKWLKGNWRREETRCEHFRRGPLGWGEN